MIGSKEVSYYGRSISPKLYLSIILKSLLANVAQQTETSKAGWQLMTDAQRDTHSLTDEKVQV